MHSITRLLGTGQAITHTSDPTEMDVAALLTLKANWFDTLIVKQWEIVIVFRDQ